MTRPLILLVALLLLASCASSDKAQPNYVLPERETGPLSAATARNEGIFYGWDEFKHYNTTIWHCRDVRSGAFVPPRFCAYLKKEDFQWLGKATPANFVGILSDEPR